MTASLLSHAVMFKLFTSHPDSVGESYLQHAGFAMSFGLRMFVGALACMLHGLFPFLFQRTGSRIIRELNQKLVTHRPDTLAANEDSAAAH
jgi:hypothetical protein